jgi:UDP-N-acetylglucosamine 2-epimerase (non-hydrolysing)
MSHTFFKDLGIIKPDFYLSSKSGTHAEQTGKIMVASEAIFNKIKPDVVVVVGDVNSTLACSIVAKKMNIKLAHVEAGLRSFDMTMPEEVNRIVTDSIADFFFVTEKAASSNLIKENRPRENIFFVGNVMIDNLYYQLKKSDNKSFKNSRLKTNLDNYLFLTLHRPSNVDDPVKLSAILKGLNAIATIIPIIFPQHPRTRNSINKYRIRLSNNIKTLPPLNFSESLYFWKDAKAVITDSGGLQEETTALGVPCLTLRENTERPVTVEKGTNTIIGNDIKKLRKCLNTILKNRYKKGSIPPKWDGKTAPRIIDALKKIVP